MDLVGIYILVLIKNELKQNIYIADSNTTKTGVYGTMGNKGFFTVTLNCFDTYISFGSGHFEAGQSKNSDRIDQLYQLLNKPINITDNYEDNVLTFKDMEYYIILGDLNFRIDLNYEDALVLIKEQKYDVLYGLDQFNTSRENDKFLKDFLNEREINFDPTYKYVKYSNEYAYDEDKVRVPAWTDRIFYCKKKGIIMMTYDSIKNMKYSDHRPVVGTFLINCTIKDNITKKSKSSTTIMKNLNNPNEKKDNFHNSNSNIIKNDLIDIDNKTIKQIKEINQYGGNYNKDNKNKNRSKSKKNDTQIKMYRGINFDTEIDVIGKKNNNNNKQNIYDFFVNKQIRQINNNNNSSLNSNSFFNNNNNSQNQDLLFGSSFNVNNNQNQNIFFNFNNNNNQNIFRNNN